MCTIALLLMGVGTAVQAGGAIMQGQQQEALTQAQAQALEQQALADKRAADYEVMQEGRKQDLQQSAARAAVGASGVGFQGSPSTVLAANAGQGEMDIAAIRYGSQLRQNNIKTQADISRFQGRQARQASFINAGSALVSGLSGMYDPDKAVKFGSNPFTSGLRGI